MIKINGHIYQPEYFPDGSLKLRCDVKGDKVLLQWKFETNEEMIILYFLTNHLRRVCKVNTMSLHMPYIPNARMDRVKKEDEIFTLKYFSEFLNSLKFDSVHVEDAHSPVSLALLDNVISDDIISAVKSLAEELLTDEKDILFFPDEGSSKRYSEAFQRKSAFGIKKRDWRSGNILGLDISRNDLEQGFNALIVDDICSYGGTFYHSAKKLKEMGANHIWLYVTHCENSVLKGDLIKSGLIEKLYTTDSIFTEKNEFVEILERGE